MIKRKGKSYFTGDIQVIKILCIPKVPTEVKEAKHRSVMHNSLGCELESLGCFEA